MRTWIRMMLGLFAVALLAFSLYGAGSTVLDYRENAQFQQEVITQVVSEKERQTDDSIAVTLPSAETIPMEPVLSAPISVDFDALRETAPDAIAWLYCPDTLINLPVVQGRDNNQYLYRLPDGTSNSGGTLFVDYRNNMTFTDRNTIIYGHNMKNGSMFGTLCNYKEQEYYDMHPVLWLLTPQRSYQIQLFAGFVTSPDSEPYTFFPDESDLTDYVTKAMERSTFRADVDIQENDRIVTLSTCSYEFDDARYILHGRLVQCGTAESDSDSLKP